MDSTKSNHLPLIQESHGGTYGFTLMELLVSIASFAVVMSLALGAYSTTFKVITNGDDQTKYSTRAHVTLERLIGDLQSFHLGVAGFIKGEAGYNGPSRADSMSFSSTAHLALDRQELPAGYAFITYSIEEDEETGLLRLYRADVPYRPGVAAGEDKGFLLCDGLREVMFTYYDKDGEDSDEWDSTSFTGNSGRFPAMVKIRLGFASEEDDEQTINYSAAVAMAWQ